jgi:hypothetical protein
MSLFSQIAHHALQHAVIHVAHDAVKHYGHSPHLPYNEGNKHYTNVSFVVFPNGIVMMTKEYQRLNGIQGLSL